MCMENNKAYGVLSNAVHESNLYAQQELGDNVSQCNIQGQKMKHRQIREL